MLDAQLVQRPILEDRATKRRLAPRLDAELPELSIDLGSSRFRQATDELLIQLVGPFANPVLQRAFEDSVKHGCVLSHPPADDTKMVQPDFIEPLQLLAEFAITERCQVFVETCPEFAHDALGVALEGGEILLHAAPGIAERAQDIGEQLANGEVLVPRLRLDTRRKPVAHRIDPAVDGQAAQPRQGVASTQVDVALEAT